MPSTIKQLSDRLFVQMLTPPDAQYAQVQLAQDMLAGDTTMVLGDFTIVEDENLLRQGAIVEVESELFRVIDWDYSTRVATVRGGQYSTTPAAHTVPLLATLNPAFTQQTVFEALRDNIIQLYPRLFTVRTVELTSVAGNVFPVDDDLIVEVIEAWPEQAMTDTDIDARVVSYHPQADSRAIITNVSLDVGWFRYRRRMAVATSPDDALEDLGVDDVWAMIVMVGAAADLFAGRDLPASTVQWVGGVLQAEGIPVGTRSSLSVGLARYRELLIARFAKETRGEDAHKIKVHQNEPFRSVS